MYDTLEQALDGLRDPQTFAQLASVLLLDEFPELVMGARTGDLGRDARVQRGIWGEEFVVIQYSLERKWQTKIDRELKRYETDSSLPKRMIYVTHLTATEKAQRVRVDNAAGQGVDLRIYDRGWLWPRLQKDHRKLAEELLGLRPSLPARFVEADERRAELQRRIPGFGAPLVPTPGLAQLREALSTRERRVLLLAGPGGSGKTRAALSCLPGAVRALVLKAAQRFDRDAAGALGAYEAGVLLIDDAHRLDDLSGLRALLDDAAWKDWMVVMTLRPGFAEDVLERAGVEADEIAQLAFGALGRPQAAQLLAGEPYAITQPELARHLIELAEGNPLMLHLAAEAAKRRELTPRGQADLLRGYARRLRRSLPECLHSDLVAIAAFYGRLSVSERLPIIRHLHPAAGLPEIRSALADVADAGLGLTDGDTFTVAPDAIAPIMVLDGLLRTGGSARLRLADLDLRLDAADRERVLPVFAAAVTYGDGQGREDLRAFVGDAWPAPGTGASAWVPALREVRLYARTLPQEASRVLEEVLRFPEDELVDQPAMLNAAAGAARGLADESLRAGLPPLLSLMALAGDDDERALSSPGKTVSDLLQRSPSHGGSMLTDRTVTALGVTRAWLAERAESPARQRVALRVALMLIAVAYEFIGPSASDAMAIHLGAVPAPDTREHRAAVRSAASYAAELVATVEAEALDALGSAYPSLLRRAAGVSPSPMGELPSALRAAIRPAMSIVRNAVLGSWERLPAPARLRIMQADESRRIASRSASDPEIERLSVMLGITPAAKSRAREWEGLQRRARELGRELGPDGSLELLAEALGHANAGFRVSGARSLLTGAGERASRAEVAAGLERMSADPALHPYLGCLLVGALQGPGVAAKTLRELAADAKTAAQTVDVLNLVKPPTEQRLTKLLFGQPTAHPALADHLRTCRRPEAEKAEALVGLAERTGTDLLAQVLEQFGALETSVAIPRGLRERFIAQMERVARETALDKRETGNVSDAFTLVVRGGDDRWLGILDVRRNAMLADAASGDHRFWDFVPDDFGPGLAELSAHQRDQALPRLAAWLSDADRDPLAWRVGHGLTELLPGIGAALPAFPELLQRWYIERGTARGRTLRLLSALLARGAAAPVLDAILEHAATADEESELIGALSLPPTSWAGDLEQEYTKRADVFAKRSPRGTQRARAFARATEAQLRALAEQEAQQTRQRREGYER